MIRQKTFPRLLPALVLAGFISGCSTTEPSASLQPTRDLIAERAGASPARPLDEDARRKVEVETRRWLAEGLDAESAVRITLLNNRHIRQSVEETGMAQAELDQAGFLPNPTFSGSTRWPDSRPRGPNVELSAAFDFLDALLIPLRKNIAKENLAKVRAAVAHEVLLRVAETRETFYTHLAKKEIEAKTDFIARVNEASLKFARRRFDAGNINALELGRFTAAAAQSHIDLTRAGAASRIAREELNRSLGLSGAGAAEWKAKGELQAAAGTDPAPGGLEDFAAAHRLDLAAARADTRAAEHALSLKEDTRFLPAGVSVGVDTERESGGARLTGPTLSLALPIFDQGQAEIARLESIVRLMRDREAALENDIRAETRIALERLGAARANTDYYRETLLPARSLVSGQMLLQYNAMGESAFELLNARAMEQQSARDAVEAALEYRLARVALDRAAGSMLPDGNPPAATGSAPSANEKPDTKSALLPGTPHPHHLAE